MNIIDPSFEVLGNVNGNDILRSLEVIGRTCYKSETLITPYSSKIFVKNIITNGHESVLEHHIISAKITCDRGISHELVRHRIASFSQESTRYCNYYKKGEITFIRPCFWKESSYEYTVWVDSMEVAEKNYLFLIETGSTPQEARSILPNSLKTEIVMTMNLREWRHFFKLRALGIAGKPHPQMLEITIPMLEVFKTLIPIVFNDLQIIK